jgi:hypothetical protein
MKRALFNYSQYSDPHLEKLSLSSRTRPQLSESSTEALPPMTRLPISWTRSEIASIRRLKEPDGGGADLRDSCGAVGYRQWEWHRIKGYLEECIALLDQALEISAWLSKLDVHACGVERYVCGLTIWTVNGRKAPTRRGKVVNLKGGGGFFERWEA